MNYKIALFDVVVSIKQASSLIFYNYSDYISLGCRFQDVWIAGSKKNVVKIEACLNFFKCFYGESAHGQIAYSFAFVDSYGGFRVLALSN